MTVTAIILVGILALLGVGIWLEIRSKKGRSRPLSKMRPSALSVFPKTMPSHNEGPRDVAAFGLNEQRQAQLEDQRRHRQSAKKRAQHDLRLEKQKRIRPWDEH